MLQTTMRMINAFAIKLSLLTVDVVQKRKGTVKEKKAPLFRAAGRSPQNPVRDILYWHESKSEEWA